MKRAHMAALSTSSAGTGAQVQAQHSVVVQASGQSGESRLAEPVSHSPQSAGEALRAALSGGPTESRTVIQALVQQGFTPKQIRRARERLGLEVARSGTGASTRTSWVLPAGPVGVSAAPEPEAAMPAAGMPASRALLRKGKVSEHRDDDLQPFERQRIAARIDLFVAKGIAPGEAAEVARLLVYARDRAGTRDGSCAECQCLQADRRCSVAIAGIAAGPRPLGDLWACGYARRDSP